MYKHCVGAKIYLTDTCESQFDHCDNLEESFQTYYGNTFYVNEKS